jgi:hypothetical protein
MTLSITMFSLTILSITMRKCTQCACECCYAEFCNGMFRPVSSLFVTSWKILLIIYKKLAIRHKTVLKGQEFQICAYLFFKFSSCLDIWNILQKSCKTYLGGRNWKLSITVHCAECHNAECHYAECHCAECHYAECH